MNTEQLIRDLIVEDQFKAKYTKRQRSVFCKNMYAKVASFIEEHEKETLTRLHMHHEANVLMKKKMMQYYTLYLIYKIAAFVLILAIYSDYLCPKKHQILTKG